MSRHKNIFFITLFIAGLIFCLQACRTSGKGRTIHFGATTVTGNVLKRMQLAMGELPSFKNLPPFQTIILDSLQGNGYKRYHLKFTVAENEILPALLYIPERKSNKTKVPAMMVLHSTDQLGKMVVTGESPKRGRAYAIELAERGYVVIAPDYPSFGEMKDYNFGNDRYVSGTMKGIFDHMRCVDFLQTRPEVDKNRIGVLGHSLGGHNAIFVSAFDPRLKVTVSSCGWTLFDYYDAGEAVTKLHGGKIGPWAQERYMPLIKTKYHLDPKQVPFDFDKVIASIAPRAFFTNSPLHDANFNNEGVREGMKYIEKAYKSVNASNNLKGAYPDSGHNFPDETRLEAYCFIDKILQHTPNVHQLHK